MDKLILKTKLQPTQPGPNDMYYEKPLPRAEYFKHAFEGLEDSLKVKIDNGFDAKANYADSATHYLERNKELWKYQKENGFID